VGHDITPRKLSSGQFDPIFNVVDRDNSVRRFFSQIFGKQGEIFPDSDDVGKRMPGSLWKKILRIKRTDGSTVLSWGEGSPSGNLTEGERHEMVTASLGEK